MGWHIAGAQQRFEEGRKGKSQSGGRQDWVGVQRTTPLQGKQTDGQTEASGDSSQLCDWPKPLARWISSSWEVHLAIPPGGLEMTFVCDPTAAFPLVACCVVLTGLTEIGSFST